MIIMGWVAGWVGGMGGGCTAPDHTNKLQETDYKIKCINLLTVKIYKIYIQNVY